MEDRDSSGWASFGKFVAWIAGIAVICAALYGIWYWGGTSRDREVADLTEKLERNLETAKSKKAEALQNLQQQTLATLMTIQDCVSDQECRKALETLSQSRESHLTFRDGNLYRTCIEMQIKSTDQWGREVVEPQVFQARFKFEYSPDGRVTSVHYPYLVRAESCLSALATN